MSETLPVMLVYLEPGGTLAWKPQDKGARWHSGCRDIDEVAKAWDAAGLPSHCLMEYVDHK